MVKNGISRLELRQIVTDKFSYPWILSSSPKSYTQIAKLFRENFTYPVKKFWLEKVALVFGIKLLGSRYNLEMDSFASIDDEISDLLRVKLPSFFFDPIESLMRLSVLISFRIFGYLTESALHFSN